MSRFTLSAILPLVFALGALAIPITTQAQKSKDAPAAPLPLPIVAAKKVFISNAGGDRNGLYNGGAHRLYNQFYAAVSTWRS